VPFRCLRAGRDFKDTNGDWAAINEVGAGGALLVRPDQHVAWCADDGPASAEDVMRRVTGRARM
jgi:2,4-dichlorophenol 6-monooxygenase